MRPGASAVKRTSGCAGSTTPCAAIMEGSSFGPGPPRGAATRFALDKSREIGPFDWNANVIAIRPADASTTTGAAMISQRPRMRRAPLISALPLRQVVRDAYRRNRRVLVSHDQSVFEMLDSIGITE